MSEVNPQALAQAIDHTLLRADATAPDIEKLCAEARAHIVDALKDSARGSSGERGRRFRATLLSLLLLPGRGLEQPLVQAQAAFAERVLQALVRPGHMAIE